MEYSIDTSAILDGWRRYYPPDVFPPLWNRIEGLIAKGQLVAVEEVLHELRKKDDEVTEWARNNKGLFVPIDQDVQIALAEILSRFDRLVNTQRNRSSADPWVIALAKAKGCTVITGETPSGNLRRPKIPDVCAALGIRAISLLRLFREQQWVFR